MTDTDKHISITISTDKLRSPWVYVDNCNSNLVLQYSFQVFYLSMSVNSFRQWEVWSLICSTFTYLLSQVTYLFNVTNLPTTLAANLALPTLSLHFFRCQACCCQHLHGTNFTGKGKGKERWANILIMKQYF